MTAIRLLNRIALTVTGARGPVGLDMAGAAVVGQFLVWDAERRVRSASGTGADTGLRTDLASPTGAPLVGTGDGRSVQTRLDMVDQSVNAAPLGNSSTSKTSLWTPIQSQQANAAFREFGEVRTFYARHGYQANPANRDVYGKITSYQSMWLAPGAPDGWVRNALLHHETNDPINTHVDELDYDIISTNKYGFGLTGGATLANGQRAEGTAIGNVSAIGHAVTGVSVNGGTINTAYLAASISPSLFTNGYAAASGCSYSSFLSASAAKYGFLTSGAHIDAYNTELAALSGSALHMANGHQISALSTGGVRQSLIALDGTNNLQIGPGSSVANIVVYKSILPAADNTYDIGSSANRIKSISLANAPIVTSARALKDNITDITWSAAFIDAIEPATFTMKEREKRAITAIEEQDVVTGYETVSVTISTKRGPITQDMRVAITERKPVEVVTGYEPVAGVRPHAGFIADNVKAAAEAAGVADLAVYTKDADSGLEGVRYDEVLAVAVAEIKALRARVAALEAK